MTMKWLENGQPLPGPTKIIGAANLGKHGKRPIEHIDQIDPPEHVNMCLSCTLKECVGKSSVYCPLNGTDYERRYIKCDKEMIREMRLKGSTVQEIARTTGSSVNAVRYHLRRMGLMGAAG